MDGRSSAPGPDPESPGLTEGSPRPSDTERELAALRARAYGPDADIATDPAAMVRLAELEAVHLEAAHHATAAARARSIEANADAAAAASEPLQNATRRRPVRAWIVAGAVVVAGIAIAAAEWSLAARPDVTLRQVGDGAGSDITRVLNAQGMGVDVSTLREFERYHDVAVWSAVNSAGRVCFTVWDLAASGRFSSKCAPPGKEVSLTLSVDSEGDDFGRWLPDGSSVDFRFHDDTVEVFEQPPP
ncbi:hypothetical protein ACFC1I_05865 [Microbacterium sp. NPDC056044]|uniref:hypothetical protein n=1 Tax=Microbacterium sp. NPDC056044 TaxID=3345690 RepID=UPI0035DF209C